MKTYLFTLSLLISFSIRICAQIPALERVEPAFWWVGMKNPKLQLLIHGNKIADYEVKINYPGITIVKVNKVENPNYLFVDLEIATTTNAGSFPIELTKKNAKPLKYTYILKKREQSSNRIQGVNSSDLIYLLMPDRFANGDPKNDVIKGMKETTLNRDSMYYRHGGDIQGVIDRLPYLKDLGITTIWMTPEIENDQPQASYHGYAVTDHYKIDPRYGTNELYKSFVEKCHAMGLKVIKDVVHNHIGSEHWLMKDLPMKDWVHQWSQFTQTSYKEQTIIDPYASASDLKKMVDGWFVKTMPDLNHHNPYVQNYLNQNHIWWIEYAGIDGLRLDTYHYNDLTYMRDWYTAVHLEFPKLSVFGETLVNSVVSQVYFTGGRTLNQPIDTQLPGVTDVQLKDAIYEALNGKLGWTDGINRLYNVISQDLVYKNPMQNILFFDNHDMSRYYSIINEDMAKYKSGLAILFTLPRIPQVYYGTEILMKNFSNPDGLVREDFKGGWTADKENKFTAQGRTEKENEAFDYFKKLATYRKNNEVLQTGKMMQFVPERGIYVYYRYNNQKTIMVVTNSNDKDERLSTYDTDRFVEITNGFNTAINVLTGDKLPTIQTMALPAKTTLILELQK